MKGFAGVTDSEHEVVQVKAFCCVGGTAGSKPWPPGRWLPTGRGEGEGKEFGTGVILLSSSMNVIDLR